MCIYVIPPFHPSIKRRNLISTKKPDLSIAVENLVVRSNTSYLIPNSSSDLIHRGLYP